LSAIAKQSALVTKSARVLVMGAGLSGLASARLVAALGGQAEVSDRRPAAELGTAARVLAGLGVPLIDEVQAGRRLAGADLLVLSPGVPLGHELVAKAGRLGVKVVGELELAARSVDVPILAVTGTNGKTSTTSLTAMILESAGLSAFVGGNIGTPLSDLAADLIAGAATPDWAVLEVSSFQLETVESFTAKAAAFLNLTPDHLDRHGSMAAYLKIKSRIFDRLGNGDLAVVNLDDPLVGALAVPGRRFGFSGTNRPAFGGWAAGGAGPEARLELVEGGRVLASAPWADFRLKGAHNQHNVLAACGLAMAAGVDPAAALEAAKLFRPGDHRLETVGEFGGVLWIDDSKGTNIGAVQSALDSVDRPVVLILGGRDKGLDFGGLAPAVGGKVKRLVLLGECRLKIRDALGSAAPWVLASTMAEAVALAAEAAEAGDAVLLSPACASFDLFRDYKERGEVFRAEALALAAGAKAGGGGEG
jgi:UDP-N-acetylmuramoylalanine--D-glutamate ligase